MLGLAAAAGSDVTSAHAASRATVDTALEEVYRGEDYQRELPGPGVAPRPPPDWLAAVGEIIRIALWAAVIALVAWAVVSLFRFSGRGTAMKLPARSSPLPDRVSIGGGEGQSTHEDTGPSLASADRLAKEGHFEAAIHTLLLYCIGELSRARSRAVADAMTSREILRGLVGRQADEIPFRRLVNAVEATHFGDRSASAEMFAACRRDCLAATSTLGGAIP